MPTPILQRIVVPPSGLAEQAVFSALGLNWRDVYPLYGDRIGAPRHYRSGARGAVFTLEGVRCLAQMFSMPVEVTTPEEVDEKFWWRHEP